MRRRHYNTRQAVAGSRQCNYCNKYASTLTACKCSVTITFRGDEDVIESTIARMRDDAGIELLEIDDEYKGGINSGEVTITAVFAADGIPSVFRE